MANKEHLDILKQGVEVWNQWREKYPDIQPDLFEADLSRVNLHRVNLSGANLRGAKLRRANLSEANLSDADLYGAKLDGAKLSTAEITRAKLGYAILRNTDLSGASFLGASLFEADLSGADLSEADLTKADLEKANLSGANLNAANLYQAYLYETNLSSAQLNHTILSRAILLNTDLTKTTLNDCLIYGISAWGIHLDQAVQHNLIITPYGHSTITVDNLEVAQFIYLLLNNPKIRDVIDTIARKAVLILGRFTPERKAVLDALRDALRLQGYLPILFDFEKPASRDITETISTLAHLARFVIADLTDAKSISQELMLIVPNLPSVPVQPLILNSQHEYGMFEHFTRFPWVLPVYRYRDEVNLLQALQENVIAPAEQKAKELAP